MNVKLKATVLAIIIILTIALSLYYRNFNATLFAEKMISLDIVSKFFIVILLLLIQTFVISIPTTPITMIIVPNFFPVLYQAILVNILSQITVAILVFLLFKYLLSGVVGIDKFKKLIDLREKYGVLSVFLARIIPVFGFDAVNIGFAVIGMKNKEYIIGTILGLSIVLPIWTYFGWIAF